jgi:Polyketide cyclase / dehydrase and lipid transport
VASATREILASPREVWSFLAEPYHLPDWWPGYAGVEPDRRGLETGARWKVQRSARGSLFRKPRSDGLIILRVVDPPFELAWHDVQQELDYGIALAGKEGGTTIATVTVSGSWRRLLKEGIRSQPETALDRLHALVQTAATL